MCLVFSGLFQSKTGRWQTKYCDNLYPVYEFTKQVAGDTANVELLIGAGTEPHEYEPSAKAVAKIQDADTFVYENENMETWVPKLLDTLDKKKVKTIKATGDMLLFARWWGRRGETMTMEKKAITMSTIPMFGYHQFVPLNL